MVVLQHSRPRNFRSNVRRVAFRLLLGILVFFFIVTWVLSFYKTFLSLRGTETAKAASAALDSSVPAKTDRWKFQPDLPASHLQCSWRECVKKVRSGPDCAKFCRDSLADMGRPPDVKKKWVPDVRILRRAAARGLDESGRVWPPELPLDLCEPMGPSGGRSDENLRGFREAGVRAAPIDAGVGGTSVLCLMYTVSEAHATSVRAARETWANGCDGFLAFSTSDDPRIPAISLPHDGEESYSNMWQKVRSIWRFVCEHYAEDFDFFFIGGDDLFVLPGNLRIYLASLAPDEDHFVGRRFKGYGKDNYFNSGGAGYTLSRSLLKKFVSNLDNRSCNPERVTSMEDVMIAECIRNVLDISLTDTRDDRGRERFHPFSPGSHIGWRHPIPPKTDWYEDYNREWGLKLGADSMAPDSVSFHYIKKPAMTRHLHQLLYNCGDIATLK